MRSWGWGLVATVIFALLYWAFAAQLSGSEAVAMLIALGAALALMVAMHRVAERRFEARAPWIRLLWHTTASLAKDSGKVGLMLVRSLLRRPAYPAGAMLRQPFRFGGDTARDATRRALVTLSVSASPDRYVIDANRDDSLLAHSLVGRPAQSDREWPV